uniref:beta-N-acetylhexosaminidase n=1 Tax=Glossina brevipalpis TaxID=37001 RepID=A0A1A9WED6_9MUSC
MAAFICLLKVFIILTTISYWYPNGRNPKCLVNANHVNSEVDSVHKDYLNSDGNQWIYECVNEKCVRRHYNKLKKFNKSMSFLTCSMTCGDIKIWPYPTIETRVQKKSLKFTLDTILLRLHVTHGRVMTDFHSVFNIFLDDLKGIQSRQTSTDLHHDELDSKNASALEYGRERDIDMFRINVFINNFADLKLSLETDEINARHYDANITANSFYGARHALSTLQQLVWFDEREHSWLTLSKIDIKDAPRFRYRGLMLDTSRHYFSVDAIKRTIAAMSHAKLNRFHWHITDSQSFPYVSKHYPELAEYGAYSRKETYTLDNIRDVTSFAKLRGIQIITEIDAPAHAGNGWNWGPDKGLGELALCVNQQPWTKFCGQPPCGQLNPKNNNTLLILQKLKNTALPTKMDLIPLLAKALIILLTVSQWKLKGLNPQSLRNGYGVQYINYSESAENKWLYGCINKACVRRHYLNVKKFDNPMSFLTCSMTCGSVKIWPYPTNEARVQAKLLKFNLNSILLQSLIPNSPSKRYFQSVFKIFLDDLNGIQSRQTSTDLHHDELDSKNASALEYGRERDIDMFRINKLYEELLDATETTDYFHLGGDEVHKNCWAQYFRPIKVKDLWYQFTLDAADRLTIANKNITPKFITVWSSDLTKKFRSPQSRFAIQVWTGQRDARELITKGYNVIYSENAWYFDCTSGSDLSEYNWESISDIGCRSWQTVYKHSPLEYLPNYSKQILGGEACLWTEQVSEWQVDGRLWPRAAALGERQVLNISIYVPLWSDPKQNISVFERMSIFRNRLVEFGIKAEAIYPQYCVQNPGECHMKYKDN